MLHKSITSLIIISILLIPAAALYAQGPTDHINDALRDLSIRLGRTVALGDLTVWTWREEVFVDTSLGCPQPGQSYMPASTRGYVLLITYNNVTYDYRISSDRLILILCASIATPAASITTPIERTAVPQAPTLSPPTAMPTPLPTAPNTGTVLIHCSPTLPSRLMIGQQARVTPGLPNNVREQPATGSRLVGEIPASGEFMVLAGPQCNAGLAWWQVDYNGLTGWTPEGEGQSYWLEPLALGRPVISIENAAQLIETAVFEAEGAGQIAWSPSGSLLAVAASAGIAVYGGSTLDNEALELPMPAGMNAITGLVFGDTDARITLAGSDNRVHIWSITPPGVEIASLTGHTGIITTVDWNINNGLIASGSLDNTVRLWNANSGLEQGVLEIGSGVSEARFNTNGVLLAVAALDGSVQVWDVSNRRQFALLRAHDGAARCVAFSPNGRILASAGDDGTIRLWDMNTNRQIAMLEGHGDSVLSIAFSPDGSVLASGGGSLLLDDADNRVILWSVAARTQAAVLEGGEAAVLTVAFSPDGTRLASASSGGAIVWAFPEG